MEAKKIERTWRVSLLALYLAAYSCVLFGVVDYLQTPNPPSPTPQAARGIQTELRRAFVPSVSATPAPQLAPGVVWVNIPSHIYHYPGYRWFGTTQRGKYMQERDALTEGDRAALNERRPAFFDTAKP